MISSSARASWAAARSAGACRATSTLPTGRSRSIQNLALGAKLSEYHTGFRAYSRDLLLSLPLDANSDDFVFDNQFLAQCIYLGARIGEVSCPTRYFPEASSINFRRSTIYGFGVLKTTADCMAARLGLYRKPIFDFPPLQLKPQAVSVPAPLEEVR